MTQDKVVPPVVTPPDTPRSVVEAFLAALEARDLPGASALLAPEAWMVFPGGHKFQTLEALVDWSKTRYRSVGKIIERIDELPVDRQGITTIYCYGTLAGKGLDGRPFSGIRFIDRFEIDDAGQIVDQQVWNDLGEARR